jgi:thiamine transporter
MAHLPSPQPSPTPPGLLSGPASSGGQADQPPAGGAQADQPPAGGWARLTRLLARQYVVDRDRWGAQAIAEMAIALVLCWVLGVFRPFQMPQGGSISLEMLPIFFVAARRGLVPATVVGLLYGTMQIFVPLTPPFIYHPAQALLDYPLAFAAVGLAGLVPVVGWRSLSAAVAVGSGARLIFHFLSGWIFFASYAPQWEWPWLYALTYNLLFLVPEAVITAACLWPLLKAYDAARPGTGRRLSAPRDTA